MCNNFGFIVLELVLSAALFFGVVLSIIKMGNTGSKFERASVGRLELSYEFN